MKQHKPTCQGSPALGIDCGCGFIGHAPRPERYRASARERRELVLLMLVVIVSLLIGGVLGYLSATTHHHHTSPYEAGPPLETRYE